MLEIRNLSKVYRSKTGEEVRALDNVSISFPESGMVFILGKSGSGKSTLLNIMGGLDSYDSGEFIIKGKSSKDFGGSDFDAYRNTFIGFIFQEYNVLDDFTVGANIGLALELQGKKATAEKINEILTEVDLLNYAKRKPNELSGGQKQRVAIARALVKEPQIIMADEPTGALDSNTGKQIFDTLKKLSKEKLVLIVSHDRDFAERYADRIIELSDGKIISDVTKHEHASEKLSDGIDKISGSILKIKGGYRLTPADMQMINDYLAKNQGDVILSGDSRVNEELRSAAGISETGATSVFEGTDTEKDYKLKKYEKKDSNFIRSRLPLKNALRMGSSGLKHKKFRLVMTIFLSLIAFALFGFADTMANYDKYTATTESLLDSNIKNASITLGVRHTVTYDDGETYTYYDTAMFNEDDLRELSEKTGLDFVPVFTNDYYNPYQGGFSVSSMMQSYSGNAVYSGKIHGLVNISEEQLKNTDFSITGRLPEKDGEIAITELLYRQFNEFGFSNSDFNESVGAGKLTMDEKSPNSIIGKHLTFDTHFYIGDGSNKGSSFEIVGVIDTEFDYDRYSSFLPQKESEGIVTEEGNALSDMVLQMEIASEIGYGFHALGFMTENDITSFAMSNNPFNQSLSVGMHGWNSNLYIAVTSENLSDKFGELQISEVAGSSALNSLSINWLDGRKEPVLLENEVILPSHLIENLIPYEIKNSIDTAKFNETAIGVFGADAWGNTSPDKNYYDRINEASVRKYINDMISRDDVVEAICRFALNNQGEPISSAAGAKIFWERFWFEQGNDQFPSDEDIDGKKNHHEFYDDMPEEIISYILSSCFGISKESLPTIKSYDFDYVNDILRNTSEINNEYTLSRDMIFSILRKVYATIDVYNESNKLWENNDLISVMISRGHISKQEWDERKDVEFRKSILRSFYCDMYLNDHELGYEKNPYGKSGKEIEAEAKKCFMAVCGINEEDLLSSLKFERFEQNHEFGTNSSLGTYDLKVVGTYNSSSYYFGDMIISDKILADYREWQSENQGDTGYSEDIADHANGIWAFAISPLPKDRDVIEKLVALSYSENTDLLFSMQNPIMDTLTTFNDFIEVGSKVFLYIGIGFAVFSALLLMNFIATSISYKKREIGILRAVGARSSDVFKIFFSEALIIALINFILSTAAVVAGIIITNNWMHNSGINVTLLTYGPRQFIVMLIISVGVALLASFLPVYKIAKRKPVDAIKDR